MKQISELITQPQRGSNAQTNAANASGESRKPQNSSSALTDAHIDRLWLRMAKIYGHRWVSSFGESDDGTWLAGLYGITPAQIGAGLTACLKRKPRDGSEDWPPTLSEFRAMCAPRILKIHQDYIALPKPQTDPDVVEKSIAKMKAALGI